jgi:hypothetical protein
MMVRLVACGVRECNTHREQYMEKKERETEIYIQTKII